MGFFNNCFNRICHSFLLVNRGDFLLCDRGNHRSGHADGFWCHDVVGSDLASFSLNFSFINHLRSLCDRVTHPDLA
ncbi:hypothetical protein D3C86_2055400 [compost metagenome]